MGDTIGWLDGDKDAAMVRGTCGSREGAIHEDYAGLQREAVQVGCQFLYGDLGGTVLILKGHIFQAEAMLAGEAYTLVSGRANLPRILLAHSSPFLTNMVLTQEKALPTQRELNQSFDILTNSLQTWFVK